VVRARTSLEARAVGSVNEIVEMMLAIAPAENSRLSDTTTRKLRRLTQLLITARPEAADEYARFIRIRERRLHLPEAELNDQLEGACVLVTGATGCIGSALMRQIGLHRPGRLVGVSRGNPYPWRLDDQAEYAHCDISDRAAVDTLMADIRPDIVFHVAGQRLPSVAEIEVHRTVSTNIFGTRNVLLAASEAGVLQVVSASTGKALRPYSPDVYTASKRAAEWINTDVAARSDLLCSAGRFTHVVDNSNIHKLLLEWTNNGAVRLHSSEIGFYGQSALECAQLLLVAFLGARRGEFRIHAISNLGWPLSLLDIALGVLQQEDSNAPIYFSGYDDGYEEMAFPGLYDPMTAGDVSPLLNIFETAAATTSPSAMVDACRLEMEHDSKSDKLLAVLDEVCSQTRDPTAVRMALDELSWSLFDDALRAAPRQTLARAAALVEPHRASLRPEHQRMFDGLLSHVGA
jgi:FlaA1/EpsC-like NDP-sugar epimerase